MNLRVDIELLELMLANPDCSYDHAGKYFGVTRERIRQLMMEHFPEIHTGREAFAIWKRETKIAQAKADKLARMETAECPVCLTMFTRVSNFPAPEAVLLNRMPAASLQHVLPLLPPLRPASEVQCRDDAESS